MEKTKHFNAQGHVVYCKPYRSIGSYIPEDVRAVAILAAMVLTILLV